MKKVIVMLMSLMLSNMAFATITYTATPTSIKAGTSSPLKIIGNLASGGTEDITNQYVFASTRNVSVFKIGSATYLFGALVGSSSLSGHSSDGSAFGFGISVTPGNAAKLAISAGNNQILPVSSQASPLVVKVLDSMGNGVPGYSVNWTGGSLTSQISSVSDINGLASLSYVSGPSQLTETVYAQSTVPLSGLSVLSFSLSVKAAATTASKLVFDIQPGTAATAGSVFSIQPKVSVRDVNNALVSHGLYNLQISAYKNYACTVPATGLLNGAVITSNNDGTYSFSNIQYNTAETIYLKVSSDGNLSSACSSYVKVSPASVGLTHLSFIQQPSSGKVNNSLFIYPRVALLDNLNKVTSNTDSVTVSAYSDSACSVSANLTGTLSKPAFNGLATFTDLKTLDGGSLYLSAVSGSFSVCSNIINVINGLNVVAGKNYQIQPSANSKLKIWNTTDNVLVRDNLGSFTNQDQIQSTCSLNLLSLHIPATASLDFAPECKWLVLNVSSSPIIDGTINAQNGANTGGTWTTLTPDSNGNLTGPLLSYTVAQSSGGQGGSVTGETGAEKHFPGDSYYGNGGGGEGGFFGSNGYMGQYGKSGENATISAGGAGGKGCEDYIVALQQPGPGGEGALVYSNNGKDAPASRTESWYICNGGGGGGSRGLHGQGLYLKVNGTIIGTGSIIASGTAGGAGGAGSTGSKVIFYYFTGGGGGGGGAGGSGGDVFVSYKTGSQAPTVTLQANGGIGGSGGSGDDPTTADSDNFNYTKRISKPGISGDSGSSGFVQLFTH